MESIINIQYNKTKITDIASFIGFKGFTQGETKEVCFVRGIGVHGDYISEIERMDSTLMTEMNQGKGLYSRIEALPVMKSAEDISFYSNAYDDWVKTGKKEMRIHSTREEEGRAARLSKVCQSMEDIFLQDKKQATDTMLKNFLVKLLFWYESVFNQNCFFWDDTKIMKLVAFNIEKRQEYLFFYMVSLLGINVLLLQSKVDIGAEEEKLDYSQRFVLGEFKEIKVPVYQWKECVVTRQVTPQIASNQNDLNSNGRITVKIPERNRPSRHPASDVQRQQSNTQEQNVSGGNNSQQGNPRLVIPPRPGASDTKAVKSGRQVSITTPTRPVVTNSGDQREEKSFEELALLASSIVLITVFDAKGERLGSGSGIMIGKDGYILTNNHVAAGGRSFSVRIEDDEKEYLTDEIIKYHSLLDLAIIRIQRRLNPIPVYRGNKPLVRGQKVVAIGSPLGLFNSVSNGIISGFRKIDDVDMIQFTAPISRGSSGGAVLNMQGEVVGISTAGIDEGQNIVIAMGYECINMFIRGFIQN